MNTHLLLRVRSAILAHPDQFEMAGYFGRYIWFSTKTGSVKRPAGGTAACIGGWGVFLARKLRTLAQTEHAVGNNLDTHDEAVTAFDLTREETLRLFYTSQWPPKFADRYNKAKSVRPRARAAADRISWFIKTKGTE